MTKAETAATPAESKAPKAAGPVKIEAKRENYIDVRSASGSKSMNNGDPVASILQGMDVEQVCKVASGVVGKEEVAKLIPKYAHLNVGMQRMNIGNKIRAWYNKYEDKKAALAILHEHADPIIAGINQKKAEAQRAKDAAKQAKAAEKTAAKAPEAKAPESVAGAKGKTPAKTASK